MKKKIIFCILLVTSVNLFPEQVRVFKNNSYKGKTVETVFNKNDEMYGKLQKKTEYYDASGNLKKTEYYNSPGVINETGIAAQFQYYNDDQVVTGYEIFYSPDVTATTNISKIIEYVDAEDNITKIEYYKDSELVDVETENFRSAGFLKFNYHVTDVTRSYAEKKKEGLTTDFYIYETATVKLKAVAVYQNRMMDISEQEHKYLETYSKCRNDKDLENYFKTLYKRKILVKENDITCWVLMQESLIPHIKKNQKMLITYYFIGGINGIPVFAAIQFNDL